jgi:hypothetical protein
VVLIGTLNVLGEPRFLDPAAGDYHIEPGSAALNQGVATDVSRDLDGRDPMGSQTSAPTNTGLAGRQERFICQL